MHSSITRLRMVYAQQQLWWRLSVRSNAERHPAGVNSWGERITAFTSRPPSRIIPPHTGNREVICRLFPFSVSPISAACSIISKRPHLHNSQALPSTFSHHHSCLMDPLKRYPAKKAKPSDTPDTRTFQVVGDLTTKSAI